jgi:hypothetical protein
MLVVEIAMRVLQQMFAPHAQVLINCLRHVVHAVMGVRPAALQVLSARLAKMGFISPQTLAQRVGLVVKRALQTPFALHATRATF